MSDKDMVTVYERRDGEQTRIMVRVLVFGVGRVFPRSPSRWASRQRIR